MKNGTKKLLASIDWWAVMFWAVWLGSAAIVVIDVFVWRK